MKKNQRHMEIASADVVLIKGNDKHRDKWNHGILRNYTKGRIT